MYQALNIDKNELWKMSYEEFNKWRIENDFPRILKFFQEKLVGFSKWQKEYDLTDEEIIRIGIVDVIKPNKFVYFTTSFDKDNKLYDFVSNKQSKIDTQYGDEPNNIYIIKASKGFFSYLTWAKKKKIKIHPRSNSNRLSVTTIEAVFVPELCRVIVLDELELLKLGGIEKPIHYSLGGKYLSFLNLDYLNFEGTYYDSMQKEITFSSCRNWKINNTDLHFLKLYSSNLEGLQIENSKIDAWNIEYCEGYDVKIVNSVLMRCVIGVGNFIPYFDNVDLRDSKLSDDYLKDKTFNYPPNIELLRRFKNSFLFRGQHDIAGNYFYLERFVQRKMDFREIIFHLKRTFVPRNLFNKKIFRINWMIYHFKNFLKYLLKYLLGFVSWLWWGYGERPSRIIVNSLFILIIGTILISYTNNFAHYSIWDAIYYTVISFLTLGDSTFQPHGITRVIVSALALLGILNLGLLIAGFVNKSKY